MIKILIIIIAVLAALYIADRMGIMVIQVKRAVFYSASLWGKRVSFSACTGHTKRSVWFNENRAYHFEFSPEITKGTVSVEILDPAKKRILLLDAENRTGDVPAEKGKRYCMLVRFQSASGKYEIDWK